MAAEVRRVGLEREWLLRTLLVLQRPTTVFAALRRDDDEGAHARQEPITALVLLAGVAGVLGTSVAARLLDDPQLDGLAVAVWAFVGGGVYGAVAYFAIGGVLYLAARALGGLGSYRRARHVVGFASAPLALALLVVWPIGLAAFGGDLFRSGGVDGGAGGAVFSTALAAFVGWAIGLLAVGVRAVHGWPWPRALAATALTIAPFAFFVAVERF